MKVLLIRPPYSRLKGTGQAPYFPLGLGYIASVLTENGFEAKIYHAENTRLKHEGIILDAEAGYDARSIGHRKYMDSIKNPDHYVWKEVKDTLEAYKPDIVGISLLSVEVSSALKISRLCKQFSNNCHVVWGGLHPTFLPSDCLKNKEVDFVIRGEGEYPMLELCRSLQKGSKLSGVPSLSYRNNGEIIHNETAKAIPNIDDIPFPARDSVLYPESFDYKSFGSMIVSRGCPFRCSFCSSRNFWDSKVRFRSPPNIIQEIKTLKNNYGTKFFMFWDDSFTINRSIIENQCRAFIDADIGINWKTATRADLIDEDILNLMKKSGCVKLEIGVESGSDRIKKIIHKDVSNDQIMRAFSLINKSGIGSGAFFMAGFPDETIDDMDQTFQLMKELDAGEIAFNIFDPMPGSTEYDRCIERGLVPKDPDWNNFPLWPDAHYVSNISRENFTERANKIAKWLFIHNNSLKSKLRRNKHLILFLLKNDPGLLFKKGYRFINERMKVHSLKSEPGCCEKKP
jgi:anaerobic magnesium-protoporphyrin IX monomethyl ester cyclase